MASTSAVRFQRDRQDLGQPWKGWRAALTDCAGFTQGPWFASPAPPRHTGSSLPARYPAPVLSTRPQRTGSAYLHRKLVGGRARLHNS